MPNCFELSNMKSTLNSQKALESLLGSFGKAQTHCDAGGPHVYISVPPCFAQFVFEMLKCFEFSNKHSTLNISLHPKCPRINNFWQSADLPWCWCAKCVHFSISLLCSIWSELSYMYSTQNMSSHPKNQVIWKFRQSVEKLRCLCA